MKKTTILIATLIGGLTMAPAAWATSIKDLKRQAYRGDANAQYEVAEYYNDKENYKKAERWYESAEQGHTEAQHMMGLLYYRGSGVERDYSKARAWSETSAKKGYGPSFISLAELFENGFGVKRDYVEALRLYKAAAKFGVNRPGKIGKLTKYIEANNIESFEVKYGSIQIGKTKCQEGLTAAGYVNGDSRLSISPITGGMTAKLQSKALDVDWALGGIITCDNLNEYIEGVSVYFPISMVRNLDVALAEKHTRHAAFFSDKGISQALYHSK